MGYNDYLVNSKSNCEFYMVFRDLLFLSNTSYGFKMNEMRKILNKNYLISFLWILRILKPDRDLD